MIPQPPRQLGFAARWHALRERPRSLFFGFALTLIPLLQYVVFSFLFVPLFQNQHSQNIRAAGKAAKGEVIRIEDVPTVTVNGVHPKRIVFRYKVDGMEQDASMETVSVAEVSNWQKGRPVEIRYFDRRAEIDGLQPVAFPFPLAAMLFAPYAMFFLVGLPFLAYSSIGVLRKYRLLKYGVVRPAKLFSFEAENSLFPWPPPGPFRFSWRATACFKATYTYTDSTGRGLSGSSPSTDLMLLNQKKKGDEIEILVLPNDERRSALLDSATERALAFA
jgi:hypothetical protein